MKKTQEQETVMKGIAEQPNASIISDKDKVTIKAFDAEDKIEFERREAYIEPETRDLLRKLLQDGDEEEIIPIYSSGIGFVYQVTGNASN